MGERTTLAAKLGNRPESGITCAILLYGEINKHISFESHYIAHKIQSVSGAYV